MAPGKVSEKFSPGKNRAVTGFSSGEYTAHIRWGGGHPNPAGRWLLPNHTGFPIDPALLVVDLAQHLTETIDLVADILPTLPMLDLSQLPPQRDLPEICKRWRADDPDASRVAIPDT